MEHCTFCKIIQREIPAEILYEDTNSVAFLDINPVNFGHLLVIPKAHYERMTDAPDEVVANVFIRTKHLMPVLQKAVGADFVAVSIVGIDVPHFHVHLIPRFANDGLKNFWPTKKYETPEKMKEVGANIRANIPTN